MHRIFQYTLVCHSILTSSALLLLASSSDPGKETYLVLPNNFAFSWVVTMLSGAIYDTEVVSVDDCIETAWRTISSRIKAGRSVAGSGNEMILTQV